MINNILSTKCERHGDQKLLADYMNRKEQSIIKILLMKENVICKFH